VSKDREVAGSNGTGTDVCTRKSRRVHQIFFIKEVKMQKRILLHLGILSLLLILFTSSASAWARHDQTTTEVVRDLGWLDRFSNVTVTEYLYDDQTINDVKIRYYNPEPKYLEPDEFYYHFLYEPVQFFQGAEVGKTISAKQILIDFCDEPDWEMDQHLQLSWMQAFHGESQGYRHLYYPTGSFHIPMGFIGQGRAPARAQHFYDLAKFAFERGDAYWGFRFLARALHYVQDMSQPMHTRQFHWSYIDVIDPYYGTLQTIKNYHFAFESYIANSFRLEQQDVLPKRFVSAVRYSLPVPADSAEGLAKYIARRSYWQSSNTWKITAEFFGDRHKSNKATAISEDDFFELIARDDEVALRFNEDIESRMVLWGKATKSFLEFARKDLNLDEYSIS